MSLPTEIRKKYLLLCEGADCEYFLINYFLFLEKQGSPQFQDKIQLINFGGNSQLSETLKLIKMMRNFSNVRSLLIVRDAEKDAPAALQSVQNTLKSSSLPIPIKPGEWGEKGGIKAAYLLFPTCQEEIHEGTLEDLCVDILKHESESCQDINLIIDWMYKLENEYGKEWKWPHKTRLNLYFSINNKYVGMKLGEAAKAHAFNWDSPLLQNLKSCIEQGFN